MGRKESEREKRVEERRGEKGDKGPLNVSFDVSGGHGISVPVAVAGWPFLHAIRSTGSIGASV
jgi:hypothetical protein